MKKKSIIMLVVSVLIIITIIVCAFVFNDKGNDLQSLPKPEVTGGVRGEFGIDKNINEETIDNYLNRKDSVYRDMRMLKDPGNYEAIGGDAYLSGFVKGFEVVPYPYLVNVSGLPTKLEFAAQALQPSLLALVQYVLVELSLLFIVSHENFPILSSLTTFNELLFSIEIIRYIFSSILI